MPLGTVCNSIIVIVVALVIYIIIYRHQEQLKSYKVLFKDKLKDEWEKYTFVVRELGILIINNADKANIENTVANLGKIQSDIVELMITESEKDKKLKINRSDIKSRLIEGLNNHVLLLSKLILDLKEGKTVDSTELKQNNEYIAKALDNLSPWISLNRARDLFSNYTNFLSAQFLSYKNRDWESSSYSFDNALDASIDLSNYISDAISWD
jgi:hypothetical protein